LCLDFGIHFHFKYNWKKELFFLIYAMVLYSMVFLVDKAYIFMTLIVLVKFHISDMNYKLIM